MYLISLFIYMLISLAAGLGLIGLSLNIGWLSIKTYIDYLSFLSADTLLVRITTFLSGSLIILIFLRFIQKGLIRSRRQKTIKTETETGQISITLMAIEDMIKKVLGSDDVITSIRPKVISTKRDVIAQIKLGLKTEINIKDFAEEVQEKVKEKIQALLGKERNVKVNVEIKKISFSKKDAIQEEPEEEEEGPFRNY